MKSLLYIHNISGIICGLDFFMVRASKKAPIIKGRGAASVSSTLSTVHDGYLFSCAHHTLSPEQENSNQYNFKHKEDKNCAVAYLALGVEF